MAILNLEDYPRLESWIRRPISFKQFEKANLPQFTEAAGRPKPTLPSRSAPPATSRHAAIPRSASIKATELATEPDSVIESSVEEPTSQ